MHKFIQQLKQKLAQPLPSLDTQLKMTSRSLGSQKESLSAFKDVKKNAKKAGVCILLFEKDGEWKTSLMQRPASPYAHSCQVSLPGGGYEETDSSYEYTAIRETEEEFGIPKEDIEIVGAMKPLYIPVSNYLVYPHIGYLSSPPSYQPNPEEVDEIFEVPLSHLLDHRLRKIKNMETTNGYSLKNVPYYDLANKVVWGATAIMLSEFISILESDKLQ